VAAAGAVRYVSGRDGVRDRALGAVLGLALGDALGMPTQALSRARAEELLAAGPTFLAGPPDNPISAGLPAGSITDDTEQALLIGRLLIEGAGELDPHRLADALLGWEDSMIARGSRDLLGPSTRRALQAVRDGADPATTGRSGTTDGAAMRITPVAVATPSEDLPALVRAVEQASRVTHDTVPARSAAAAVAGVVSAAIDGADHHAAVGVGLAAAREADPAGTMASLIERAIQVATSTSPAADRLAAVARDVGTSLESVEAVPAAFAIAASSPDDAWRAGWFAARLGGDADTIAALAAAMVGATCGAKSLPRQALSSLRLDRREVSGVVDGLLALRRAAR